MTTIKTKEETKKILEKIGFSFSSKENKKESNKDDISIYRGYIITKAIRGYTFPNSGIAGFFKTEEEAMNRIDSIERERVKETNASIQRVDAQIKR